MYSYEHEDYRSISDVSRTIPDQVEEVFVSYNKQRGKKLKVTGTAGQKKAMEFLQTGVTAFAGEKKKK